MWKQTKVIRINECKTIADLFRVGCNWDNRINKIKTTCIRSSILVQHLSKRLDKLFDFIHTYCENEVVMSPDWYMKRKLKPLSELMKQS